MLIDGLSTALDTLRALRELGVGISIDDFGTGYSSLSATCRRFPIASLKIDRSFVDPMAEAREDAEIVRRVVRLGNVLGKT